VLAKEDAWLPVVIQRSALVDKISAGMSQIFALTCKQFFTSTGLSRTDMRFAGIVLETGVRQRSHGSVDNVCMDLETYRLWMKLGIFVQDGAAHKCTFHCKGDAGTKFCMQCVNLYAEKSEVVDEDRSAQYVRMFVSICSVNDCLLQSSCCLLKAAFALLLHQRQLPTWRGTCLRACNDPL
jgi:hypothetical protein